jgi:hypothetical protein
VKDLTFPDQRIVQFPQVKGRIAEKIELLTSPGWHAITVEFQDKTALSFALAPGFAVKAAYEERKTGKPRVKQWPEIRSYQR